MTGAARDGGESSTLTCEIDADERPSDVVIRAVAAVTNAEPTDLEPLYDSVDPDALDALAGYRGDGTADLELTFSFGGCRVTVTRRTVRVSSTPDE